MYDLPATIDYILNLTNQTKVFYIGHSQGTTQFFVMCSMRPEYNSKIRLMSAFAPVAFMSRIQGPLRAFAPVGGASSLINVIYNLDFLYTMTKELISSIFEY